MKRLQTLIVALSLSLAAFGQTPVNGSRIFVGGQDSAVASYFRPMTVNGTPSSSLCNSAQSITSSTNASPIVVTKASHGLTNGQVITLYGHATNTNANGTWMVGSVTTNTFALCGYWDGTTCQNPSTGNGVGGATGFFSTQVGRVVFRNDATAGQNLYYCTDSTGSPAWTQQVAAQSISATSHNFLTSFTQSTGAFTQAQPAFSDISGTATTGQLPNIPLSQVVSPTGAVATFADGNNPVTFNCAQTTNTQNCLTFGETSAATNGTLTNALANQLGVGISTASASTAAPLGVTQGSVTGATGPPAVQIQSTWNNASLVGEGILENVTSTSSAAGSKLLDLRVGNTAQFTVDKAGNANALTSLQTGTAPACTAGTAGAWCATEGTAFTNVSGAAGIYPDSTAHEFLAKTNGASGAGMLTRAQPGAVSLTGQTAAIANGTALCAAAAGACNTAGLYRVTFYFTCSATGTGNIGATITYTDEVGAKTAQTVPISVAGSATLATTMALNATTQNATGTIAFWSTGAAQIGYGVTDSGTGTYAVRAVVERVGL